jgi:hypothetical protein
MIDKDKFQELHIAKYKSKMFSDKYIPIIKRCLGTIKGEYPLGQYLGKSEVIDPRAKTVLDYQRELAERDAIKFGILNSHGR